MRTIVDAGTYFYGKLDRPIGTNKNEDGDNFTLVETTSRPFSLAGSEIDGHLTNVRAAGSMRSAEDDDRLRRHSLVRREFGAGQRRATHHRSPFAENAPGRTSPFRRAPCSKFGLHSPVRAAASQSRPFLPGLAARAATARRRRRGGPPRTSPAPRRLRRDRRAR